MASTASATPPTPVLQYKFNSTGSVQASTGSDALSLTTYIGSTATVLVSGSPSGPSGASTDLSLNLGPTSNTSSAGSAADGNYAPFNSLSAFTITAWIQDTAPTSRSEYIFALGLGGDSIAFALSSNGTTNQEYTKVNGDSAVYATITPPLPIATNQWTFIGVTYASTGRSSGNLVYYWGTQVGGSSLNSTTATDNQGSVNGSNTFVGIGNSSQSGLNQLQGAVDDVQFFNSALSSTDMSTVRDLDLPEPAGTAVMAAGILLFWRPSRRRRQNKCDHPCSRRHP